MTAPADCSALSSPELLEHFGRLVRYDQHCTAALLAAIGEIDERKLWARHAFPSMFAFCRERFHMSESMAGKRIWAARTARRFPIVLEMVRRGELHLSGIQKLAGHLTEENHAELLGRAKHRSARKIEELVADVAPKADVPSKIRTLPRRAEPGGAFGVGGVGTREPWAVDPDAIELPLGEVPLGEVPLGELPSAEVPAPAGDAPADDGLPGGQLPGMPRPDVAPPENASLGNERPGNEPPAGGAAPGQPSRVADSGRARGRVSPLSPRRYKLQVTIGQEARDNLSDLQDLLASQFPAADPAEVIERALDLLLRETLKRKAALCNSPRARPRSASKQPARRLMDGAGRRRLDQGADRTADADGSGSGTCDGGGGGATTPPQQSPPNREDATSRPSRAIPAAVRREVWLRDRGRCAFRDEHCGRCTGTRALEYHHEEPFAHGGRHEARNISLRCHAHNQYQADLDFGPEFMDDKRSGRRSPGQRAGRNRRHSAGRSAVARETAGSRGG